MKTLVKLTLLAGFAVMLVLSLDGMYNTCMG